MDIFEMIVFLICGITTFYFFVKWYRPLYTSWPPDRMTTVKTVFTWLPVSALAIITFTLRVLASFDVIGDFLYVVFYVAIGYAWLSVCLKMMAVFFDLSWIDDAVYLGNKAAMVAVAGGFLGITVIYSGANIGDGPGWWCVFFAGILGMIGWYAFGIGVNFFTHVFDRITIDRDISCAVRTGSYLLASGIILGRASGGDWTSFSMTVIEFLDGWPLVPLSILFVASEILLARKPTGTYNTGKDTSQLAISILWGIIYIVLAVLSVLMLPPLPVNPIYEALYGF